MSRTPLLAAALLALLVSACATSSTRPVRSEFEDIPVPKGLTYLADDSTIIESPTVKAARLIYRGRIEADSLALAMRATLEQTGWRHVSTTSGARSGTTQIYEKAGASLQVQVWEGWWFTYVELNASRALSAHGASPLGIAPPMSETPSTGQMPSTGESPVPTARPAPR